MLMRSAQVLDNKAFRRARAGVQKPLLKYVEGFVGKSSEKCRKFLTFPVSCRMTRISTENQYAAGTQKIQRFGNSFPGCFPECGY